jgi:hypothetical protein
MDRNLEIPKLTTISSLFICGSHKGPVRRSHMATRGKLNYLPPQVFCNEGQTTILVDMWEKMSEKLNLWKDEEIKR